MSDSMREFWDARARENAPWFVDTTLDYDKPDLGAFFETGERIVTHALLDAPVAPQRHDIALEIGSGLGRNCKALANHFHRVIGIDISAEMVQQARTLVMIPGVEFTVGDGASLSGIEDGSVDFILSFTVFQHLPDPGLVADYLDESARVLRPGGLLAAQWNNRPHLRYRAETAWLRLQRSLGIGGDQRHRGAAEFRGTTVTTARMRAMLERAGLSVAGIEGVRTLFAWVWAQKPDMAGARPSG